jgi:hypothetical protein
MQIPKKYINFVLKKKHKAFDFSDEEIEKLSIRLNILYRKIENKRDKDFFDYVFEKIGRNFHNFNLYETDYYYGLKHGDDLTLNGFEKYGYIMGCL